MGKLFTFNDFGIKPGFCEKFLLVIDLSITLFMPVSGRTIWINCERRLAGLS